MRIRLLICAAFALAVVPYLPLLCDPASALLFRDITNVWLPLKATWVAGVAALGHIPQWDPYHEAGARFIANVNYGPLYPLNWLLVPLTRFAGIVRAFTFFVVFHHVLICAGSFLLLRDLRVRPVLAFAGALAAAWAGAVMSSDCLVHMLGAEAGAVFFFLFWRRALRRPLPSPDLFAASFALAWPIYSGEPQASYVMAVAALAMAWRKGGPPLSCLCLFALSALAAAPQLLPTADFLRHTDRLLDHLDEAGQLSWSLHPLRLLECLFPLAFGSRPGPHGFHPQSLIGAPVMPFLFSLYTGSIPVYFAIANTFLRNPFRRKRRALGYSLFILLVTLALGSWSPLPLFKLLGNVFPLWREFRFPERLGIWISGWVFFFGMQGTEKLLRLRAPAKVLLAAGATVAALGACFVPWLLRQQLSPAPVLRTCLFVGLTMITLKCARRYTAWLLAVMLLADFAPVAHELIWAQPTAISSPDSYPWAKKILAAMEKDKPERERGQATRFFSTVERMLVSSQPDDDTVAYSRSAWAGMKFNTPTTWGIPLVRGHTSLTMDRPILHLAGISPEMADRALDLFGVRYLLVTGEPQPVALVRPSALPQASFPENAEKFTPERLADPRWDPRHSVLVDAAVGPVSHGGGVEVIQVERSWDRIRVVAVARNASPPRWLLLNESYDRLWSAHLKGTELRIERANGWAIAARLPEQKIGETFEVEFTFTDSWYEYGLGAFALWTMLFLACLAFPAQFFCLIRRSIRWPFSKSA